jgi:putative glutamine amidotransferase
MAENMTMTQPVIGLSTYLTRGLMTTYDTQLAVLPQHYVDGVTRAGGNAVLLPPQALSTSDATELVKRLDGLEVQWHPEENLSELALFRASVQAASA